ncbi:Protein MOS2 [Morella rubra]|uniref:Protein MOS2 n=1 Tax=Morella rubra TaxID=262757 RepID=A0A6A1X0N4_9ROSI|nr:Protein MOS2 [Morella rubra]
MKFSLQTKSSSKPKPIKPSQNIFDDGKKEQEDSKRLEYITEFEASETGARRKDEPKISVIPPIPNEWRPHKKMKNLELPITAQSGGSGSLNFELESGVSSLDDHDSKISYGLNRREKSESDDNHERPRSAQDSAPVEAVLLQKLKNDLDRLPEHRGMEEFEDVPVEGFGAALLAGYGWYEGRGIGKNAKGDVKVTRYEKWTDKQGLGFLGSDDKKKERREDKEKEKGRSKGEKRDRERSSSHRRSR